MDEQKRLDRQLKVTNIVFCISLSEDLLRRRMI